MPVERDTLFSDGKLAHVRAYRFVEFIPAHAEIARRIAEPNESGQDARGLGCCGVRHGLPPSGVYAGLSGFAAFAIAALASAMISLSALSPTYPS
jgi:hypothetical protein